MGATTFKMVVAVVDEEHPRLESALTPVRTEEARQSSQGGVDGDNHINGLVHCRQYCCASVAANPDVMAAVQQSGVSGDGSVECTTVDSGGGSWAMRDFEWRREGWRSSEVAKRGR